MKSFLLLMIYCGLGFAAEDAVIRKNLPDSNFPDYREPALVKDGGTIYRTLPNSTFRDYGEPGYVIRGNAIYQTLPNSNFPDYSKPSYSAPARSPGNARRR
jgi:hypothetical protein